MMMLMLVIMLIMAITLHYYYDNGTNTEMPYKMSTFHYRDLFGDRKCTEGGNSPTPAEVWWLENPVGV